MTLTTDAACRSAVAADALDGLTADPEKRELYRYDTYLREGLASFEGMRALARSHAVTFVVLKPDAVAGRRCRRLLDVLSEEGWFPLAATTVRFEPLLTRELWRYQFNAASRQRIAVVDHLLGSGPSLLVLLGDARRPEWLPASVRLTAAKGSADPEAASGADLRTRIGRVNGLFNFMHTADDPADVIRELQLFSYQAGWDWCRQALTSGGPGQPPVPDGDPTHDLLRELEAGIPQHDLDLALSLRRLEKGTDTWAELARTAAAPEHIDVWLSELGRTPLPYGSARWDVLSVVTGWIDCNEPGVLPLLATSSAHAWQHAAPGAAAPTKEGETWPS
ncbi:nucleoside-diphosphate kinase [Streptomyces monomycini]|uniref:nucleoside-diphosphate kinase n=1 Tax=Streptomyces monomycini TaxID=371720 RepID=UPI00067DCB5C|nr:nucleoside-diphosphate kinase [Streptomyces monomycini]